jgi:hypothetical protein
MIQENYQSSFCSKENVRRKTEERKKEKFLLLRCELPVTK